MSSSQKKKSAGATIAARQRRTQAPRSQRIQMSDRSINRVSAPVSLGEIQKSMFAIKPGRGKADCCVTGRDYVSTFQMLTTNVPGDNLLNFPISPSSQLFVGTRLALFGRMFEKFKFTKLNLHVTASASTSTSGSIVMAYDHDPTDATPPASAEGVRALLAYEDNVSGPVWSNQTLKCSVAKDPQKFYYTNYLGGDERLADEGQAYVNCLVTPSANVSFSLWVEYEVDLFEPQLDLSQNAELVINKTSGSTTIPSGAFNGFNWTQAVGTQILASNPIYNLGIDSAGRSFIDILKSGYYMLEQFAGAGGSLGGTLSFAAPTANAMVSGETPAVSVLSNFGSLLADGNSVSRVDKITVPQHGARIYGTNNFSDNSPAAATIRLVRSFQSLL